MAVIAPTTVDTPLARTFTWVLGVADTGAAVPADDLDATKPMTVQTVGTGTPTLSGSNDGTNFVPVTTPNPMAAGSLVAIPVAPKFFNVSANAVGAATVILHAQRR